LAAQTKPPRRWITYSLVISNLLALAFWKYIPGVLRATNSSSPFAKVALPLGISFYVFRLIHYVIEVGRGKLKSHGLGDFFGYVFLLPIFVAGPVEQFDHYQQHLEGKLTRETVIGGLTRIVHGLIKKVLIADALIGAKNVKDFLDLGNATASSTWLFLVGMYMYAYFDFSGYSDLAIGLCRLFGIRAMENFNLPILAPNISEFWTRWHMSLAGWIQRYVYHPMILRWRNPYLATVATFAVMGFWHAATWNYFAWGMFHAAGVATVATIKRIRRSRGPLKPAVGWKRYWGVPLTFAFVTLAFCFSGTNGMGMGAAVRLLRLAFGLHA
jgi:alginate O-acetyltransferase complex protein AlgI